MPDIMRAKGVHMRFASIIGVMFGLAACGGSGGGGGDGGGGIDPRLARLDIYANQNLRVLGNPAQGLEAMPVMPDAAMPTAGTINFAGNASIRVEVPNTPLVLFGDATLALDIDLGTTDGQIVNVFGQTAAGGIADYTGQITLMGGAPSQPLVVAYSGALSGGGTVLGFDGTLAGDLLGDPLDALAIADLEAAITQDAILRSGTIIVVGEVVPPVDPPS